MAVVVVTIPSPDPPCWGTTGPQALTSLAFEAARVPHLLGSLGTSGTVSALVGLNAAVLSPEGCAGPRRWNCLRRGGGEGLGLGRGGSWGGKSVSCVCRALGEVSVLRAGDG